jgi:hypothetical protein
MISFHSSKCFLDMKTLPDAKLFLQGNLHTGRPVGFHRLCP